MRIVTEIHETHSNMKESNDWQLLASALEARLQRANQLQSMDEMRRFVALHQLSVDTSGDGRVRGVKSGIKAQILAACRDAIRLLALQRASELRMALAEAKARARAAQLRRCDPPHRCPAAR